MADMTYMERREEILRILSASRYEKVNNLAFRFGVDEKTIRNDILALSCSYPVECRAGRAGGVYVTQSNWRYSNRYMSQRQAEIIKAMLPGLQPEDRAEMLNLLDVFSINIERTDK